MTNTYDETQYESYAYAQTHPEHLYTMAKLFSVQAPDIKKARVLELGCATGGNLIPMAYNLPDSHFTGIDLSAKQIDDGQTFIKQLGLNNIELKHQSILDFDPSEGKFDYIICHGIYSWVPEEVRAKIFSIFKNNLSDNGVAYISYNTMPGWCMVRSIRDMMLYHTANIQDPAQKAQQARALLHFISEGLEGEKTSYAEFLRVEINLLKNQPDSYLLHDHLEEINTPVYFYEINEQAAKHGLNYLSDAQLVSMFVGNLPPQFSQEISKVKSIVVAGQYMDFIRNQRFRATLFCHNKVQISRNLNASSVAHFHLKYAGARDRVMTEDDLKEGVEYKFKNAAITLSTSNAISKHAMKIIMEAKQPISYDDLIAQLSENTPVADTAQLKAHVNNELNLLRLILGGLITISSSPGNFVTQTNSKPKTTDLAIELSKNKNYVVNQRHEIVVLNPFERLFLQKLDGKNSKTDIINYLVEQADAGKYQVFDESKKEVKGKKQLKTQLSKLYEPTLDKFIHSALMIH